MPKKTSKKEKKKEEPTKRMQPTDGWIETTDNKGRRIRVNRK